jgi:hypothetical protein
MPAKSFAQFGCLLVNAEARSGNPTSGADLAMVAAHRIALSAVDRSVAHL